MKSINEALVLVVDDTEENVEILVDALCDDYEISVAMDGESALEAVGDEAPDIILLDVMMPDIDGYEVCKILKNDPKTSSIPIIFLTALTEIKDKTKGFEAGAVDYITKPFEILEVRARVKTHLSMYIMSQEIEEQRKIAEAHTRAKAEFLATMSHEIRTPMNGVLGMAQLLLETPLDQKQRDYAETIYSSGNALLSIINDILDHSKLEAGKLELETIPFSPEKLVISVKRLMASKTEEKGLTLSAKISDNIPNVVLGDANKIRQVMLNFLSNAIKFTESGDIVIELKMNANDELYFAIIDSGIGISKEGKDKLFRDFSQVDSSISRKYGGTGLGLSICKRIVELMDGDIGVKSDIGVGSEFWFTLPVKETNEEEVDIGGSSLNVMFKLPRMRILLAEDNKVNQQVAVGFLGSSDHDITIVENGIEAVDACRSNIYDVVLMDMQMPEMDGLTATKEIRKLESDICKVPIIALTANAMASDKDKCIEAGMTGFVSKPILANVLIKEIANVTGSETQEVIVEIEAKEDTKYFDTDQLSILERSISREAFINVLIGFIEEVKPLGEALPTIADSSDWEQLMFDAHKIKGSSGNIAMIKLASSAGQVENLTRSGNTEEAASLAHKIPEIMLNTLIDASKLYPEAFNNMELTADKESSVEKELIDSIYEGIGLMKEAIRVESIDDYEDSSDKILTLGLPNTWMKAIGEVDALVYGEKFTEALGKLHEFEDVVRSQDSSTNHSEYSEKLKDLKNALSSAKPKSIETAVGELKLAILPDELSGIIDQIVTKVNNYQYNEALGILSEYLEER